MKSLNRCNGEPMQITARTTENCLHCPAQSSAQGTSSGFIVTARSFEFLMKGRRENENIFLLFQASAGIKKPDTKYHSFSQSVQLRGVLLRGERVQVEVTTNYQVAEVIITAYRICQGIRDTRDSGAAEELAKASVVFVSNKKRVVPLWRQKAGRDEEKLVIWDYHAILLYRPDHR